MAQKTFYSQLTWHPQWFNKPTRLSLLSDYRSAIAANDDNSVIAPSHLLWHLALSQDWQWGNTELQPWAKLHNLTDQAYVGSVVVNQANGRAFEPGVGRELQVGVRIIQRW